MCTFDVTHWYYGYFRFWGVCIPEELLFGLSSSIIGEVTLIGSSITTTRTVVTLDCCVLYFLRIFWSDLSRLMIGLTKGVLNLTFFGDFNVKWCLLEGKFVLLSLQSTGSTVAMFYCEVTISYAEIGLSFYQQYPCWSIVVGVVFFLLWIWMWLNILSIW